MNYSNQFFRCLGVSKETLNAFSKKSGVSTKNLKYYNDNNILPSGNDLVKLLNATGISELKLRLSMGRLDKDLVEAIQAKADAIAKVIGLHEPTTLSPMIPATLKFETSLGQLFQGDSFSLLKQIESDSIDLVFADPPFNLAKLYPSEIDDNLKAEKYLHWCQEWLAECVRVLKPGGSLFLWNLPKWNVSLGSFLDGAMSFRNWIGVDIKYSMPIQNRLYPSHYSLLYYVKGDKPKTFKPDRSAMQTCSKCFNELKDYGGYKDKMNPLGINLTDIWTDIPPVRHAKYKRRVGANELSLKLLDRIIEMASEPGDIVLDPFGGSGTTYMAAELKQRRWVGCEIGPVDVIIERFNLINEEREILNEYRSKMNALFPEDVLRAREKRGLWTSESVRGKT